MRKPKVLTKGKELRDGIDEIDENKKKEKHLPTRLEVFPNEVKMF